MIIFAGIAIVIAGIIIWAMGDRLRFPGRLPGDIRIERGNMRIYIPITTMILVSVLLSLVLWLINKIR